MNRTPAITILAVIAVFGGIVAIVDTVRYMQWLFSPLSFIGSPLLGAGLSAVVAGIWFWAAARVWNVDPRGWLFMVAIAAIYLIFDLIAIIAGTPIELLMTSIVFCILVLILGLLPKTKEAFGMA